MFRVNSYVALGTYGSHDINVNHHWITSDRKINVTHTVGNVKVQVKTGRGGSSAFIGFYLVVPSNWSDKKVSNFIQNHFPKKKVNKTLVAAGVKFWDWDTKSQKQVAIL